MRMPFSASASNTGRAGEAMGYHTFQALVSVVLVYEHIVYMGHVSCFFCDPAHGGCVSVYVRVNLLRWFSRGASVGGAKVKLCIWAV